MVSVVSDLEFDAKGVAAEFVKARRSAGSFDEVSGRAAARPRFGLSLPGRGHRPVGRRHSRLEGRLDSRTAEPAIRRTAPRGPDLQAPACSAPMAAAVINAPVFAHGFAAIEAEFVLQLAKDAPANVTEWTAETARRFVKTMFIGIEIASSPLSQHQRLWPGRRRQRLRQQCGPAARRRSPRLAVARPRTRMHCETRIDGESSDAAMPRRSAADRWPPWRSPCGAMRGADGRCVPAISFPPAPPPACIPSRPASPPRSFSRVSAPCAAQTYP